MTPSHQSERDDSPDLKRVYAILRRNDVRQMGLPDGRVVIGVWSNLDSETIRTTLKLTGLDQLPIQYIDSSSTPDHFKTSRLSGDPVPSDVLAAMEATITDRPWKVRDELLGRMHWCNSWEEWQREVRRRAFASGAAHRL
jgi:hypothetical protein